MRMNSKHLETFLTWVALLNWPPVFILVPSTIIQMVSFLPYLFWINIPGHWLGIALVIGEPHFGISAFGALPQTPLSWVLIVGFWVLVAAAATILPELLNIKRKNKLNNEFQPAGLTVEKLPWYRWHYNSLPLVFLVVCAVDFIPTILYTNSVSLEGLLLFILPYVVIAMLSGAWLWISRKTHKTKDGVYLTRKQVNSILKNISNETLQPHDSE